jgi:hypothetical protein
MLRRYFVCRTVDPPMTEELVSPRNDMPQSFDRSA